MVCPMQGSHEQEASSRYNSGYGASTSAARSANIFTLSQDAFVHAASAPLGWYACIAGMQGSACQLLSQPVLQTDIVLMKFLPSK